MPTSNKTLKYSFTLRDYTTCSSYIDALKSREYQFCFATIVAILVTAIILFIIFLTIENSTQEDCIKRKTLLEVIKCVEENMPRSHYKKILPNEKEKAAWEYAVLKMLYMHENSINACLTLQQSNEFAILRDRFTIAPFTENNINYCILIAKKKYHQLGWGTWIVKMQKYSPTQHIHIQIPHPITDGYVHIQGLKIFQETKARSYLLAGTTRNASELHSKCQPSNYEMDAAHNSDLLFHFTFKLIYKYYKQINWNQWIGIQFHGMAETSCPGTGVFVTHGVNKVPSSNSTGDAPVIQLLKMLRKRYPDWNATTVGDEPRCSLVGSTNIQGRFVNNENASDSEVCVKSANQSSGHFMHIEQKRKYRDAHTEWVSVINSLWA